MTLQELRSFPKTTLIEIMSKANVVPDTTIKAYQELEKAATEVVTEGGSLKEKLDKLKTALRNEHLNL